ncbi:MAG: DNRLRE domain-containing protein, partial [Thermoplasmatales archaeon]
IGNWEEETVTWNSQPSYASQSTTYANVPSVTGVWMEWDVTSDVLDFLSGMQVNCGWKLTDETHWGTFDIPQTWWRSKEYGYNIPRLEIHGNNIPNMPPSNPIIGGPVSGQAGIAYVYSVVSNDPEDSELFYYVEWDDGNSSGWIGPYDSGLQATLEYTWSERGYYTIRAKAKDTLGEVSDWGYLEVRMPMNKQSPSSWWFLQFLQNHPQMFPILRHLLGL